MRNINKIKELRDDRYTIILDNKQVISIIISTISLGVVLFFTGYFIGKETVKSQKLNNEITTQNIAIISNTQKKAVSPTSQKDNSVSNPPAKKEINDEEKKTQTKNENNKSDKENKQEEKTEQNEEKQITENTKTESAQTIKENQENNNNSNKGGGEETEFKTSLTSSAEGKYVLQILATPKIKEAQELKDKLTKSGYNTFIEQVDSNGVTYNRVRIGFFDTMEKAKEFKVKFEEETGIKKTFITKKK